jgi:hypothetical protein
VFVAIYLSLAISIGTPTGWALAFAAGAAHAVQSTLYEGERTRFHRRLRGEPVLATQPSNNWLVRLYDGLAESLDGLAADFDQCLATSPHPHRLAREYGGLAVPSLRLMALLSNNARLIVIFLACLAGDPRYFWVLELTVFTLILAVGLIRLRIVERRLVLKGIS